MRVRCTLRSLLVGCTLIGSSGLVGCSKNNPGAAVDAFGETPDGAPDAAQVTDYAPPATATWHRYENNLILNPALHTYPGKTERQFNASDPCFYYDAAAHEWSVFYTSEVVSENRQNILRVKTRNLTMLDGSSEVVLTHGEAGQWDAATIETCSVLAPAQTHDGSAALYYSGSATLDGGDKDVYAIGLAKTAASGTGSFARITAAQSPKGSAGLLFTAAEAFPANPAVVKGIVTDPTVLRVAGTYKMWFFCAGQNASGQFVDGGICYATSTDGVRFQQAGPQSSLLHLGAKTVLPQQPTVVFNDAKSRYEMWVDVDDPAYASYGVAGLAVGGYYHATSTDGLTWTYASTELDFTWNKAAAAENNGLANGPEVKMVNGFLYLIFGTFTNQSLPQGYMFPFTWGLNLATEKG